MISIIKTMISKITGTWSNMHWFGKAYEGDPDNSVSGQVFQHYGFKSVPPENREVRAIMVRNGNNTWSVAESDIDFNTSAIPADVLKGTSVIYGDTHVYILGPDVTIFLTNSSGTVNSVVIDNENNKVNIKSASNVNVKAPNSVNTYYLVTEKFLTDFCNHTHTTPAGPSLGVLNLTGVGTVTPIMMAGDLTQTLKGD